jgi:hypothetical protein
MKTSKTKDCIFPAVAAVAATLCISAHAEYRCSAPPRPEDKVACDLARQDRPDELRLFIERTASIYGLYFNNYVSEEDVDRWNLARRHDERPSLSKAGESFAGKDDAESANAAMKH